MEHGFNQGIKFKRFGERYPMTSKNTVQASSENGHGLFDAEEQALLGQITAREAPYSQRARALLALIAGATQTEAGRQAGLTPGQVRYWLAKFRRDGMEIFPEELLNQAQPEIQVDAPEMQDREPSQDEEAANPEMLDAEEVIGLADLDPGQPPKKAPSKKKPKKKPKKAKKVKKTEKKKTKKEKKSKKSAKKKRSPKKKEGSQKGKSGSRK